MQILEENATARGSRERLLKQDICSHPKNNVGNKEGKRSTNKSQQKECLRLGSLLLLLFGSVVFGFLELFLLCGQG